MSMLESASSYSEVTNVDQIDQIKFKVFPEKCSICDFFYMSREEYLNKETSAKEKLLLNFHNQMVKGMIFFICCLEFGLVCLEYCLEFVLESRYLEFDLESRFQCFYDQLLTYHHLNLILSLYQFLNYILS